MRRDADCTRGVEKVYRLGRVDQGKKVFYVTHDPGLAARARRIVTVRDGVVVAE